MVCHILLTLAAVRQRTFRKFGVTPALVAMILHVVVSAGVKVSGVEVRVERSEKKSTPSIQNYSRRFTSLEIGFRARSHH